jgi:PKD domain
MAIKKSRKDRMRTTSSCFILYSSIATILSALILSSVIIDFALGIPNRYYAPLKPVVNHPPLVKVGANQTVGENATVVLNGTASDPDPGDKLSYSWKQMAGHAVKLSSSNTTNPSFTAPSVSSDTNLKFAFTAKDDKRATSITPAIIAITVKHINRPPVANAGTNQTVNTGHFVTLNGSKSKDPDGTIISYLWKQIGGPIVTLNAANTPIARFTAPKNISSDTDMIFGLTVIDNKNASNTASVKVTDKYVPPPNQPPVANAGTNQTVNTGHFVTLNGSKSKDPDGTIISYLWKQIGGPIVTLNAANTPIARFTAPKNISSDTDMIFGLTVIDNKNASNTASVKVTDKYVPPPNQPPVANAGQNMTVTSGATVFLNGSGSHDPDGNVTFYSWKQAAGPIVLLGGAHRDSKTFTAPSVLSNTSLIFSLIVTDDKGVSSTPANVAITVKPRQPTATGSITSSGGNMTSRAVAGFMSSGTINSLIHTPKAQWIATGKWRMTVDNGSLKYFETNMTWFNSNGTSSHTHEFRNLNVGGKIITIQPPGNSVSLKGIMDVGTNHHIVWRNVPTTIDIHGGKTIIISVDDKATNHHFAGQPILGVVTSFVR